MRYATVPICDACWCKEYPTQEPVRIKPEIREDEECYACKTQTHSGIYVRREIDDD